MGDRVIVVFAKTYSDGQRRASPGVYLHSSGHEIWSLLRDAVPHLRDNDASYSAARLIGFLHTKIPGRLGLGVLPPPELTALGEDGAAARAVWGRDGYGHGDNGTIVVDYGDRCVWHAEGYGAPPDAECSDDYTGQFWHRYTFPEVFGADKLADE